jgi:hypothetical protein
MNANLKIISLAALIAIISGTDCIAKDLVFGPYEVGFESYQTYDHSRSYLLGEDSISRPLLFHFWYPSKGKKTGSAMSYKHYIDLIAQREDFKRPQSEIDEFSFNYIKGYSDYAKKNFELDTSISTQEILDAPVFARSGIPIQNIGSEFPLLIYAPSNGKASVQNHLLCEYLASHGFMILSVASAGPNSRNRDKIEESAIAQVTDMEHMLNYFEDSLHIQYTKLGLFGFSSGGNAIALFQMRNEDVDAVLSMDGSQEYSLYMNIYKMKDFILDNTIVPYCSVVNNYENYSIYPFFHSMQAAEKYLIRMPYLNHYGFVSNWLFFDYCTPDTNKSKVSISFEYLSECSLGFFSKYLKSESALFDNRILTKPEDEYIEPVDYNYSVITSLCNTLLNNDLDYAAKEVENNKNVLFEGANHLTILARMVFNRDIANWLYLQNVKYNPDSWQAHFDLGFIYKEKGEILLAKEALLKAKKLNPENTDITDLLNEVNLAE